MNDEYRTMRITYVSEGRIEHPALPCGKIRETSLEIIGPASLNDSLLVKAASAE